jgi:hypothetical protein
MGLASHFGDQSYKCTNCGHTAALYAPACPVCQQKTFKLINPDKVAGFRAVRSDNEGPRATSQPPSPIAICVVIAVILAIAGSIYQMIVPPRPAVMANPAPIATPEPVAEPAPRPRPRVVHVYQPSKHVTVHPVISRPVSTSSYSPPKPKTPMKLWTTEDDGGNQ